MDQLTERLDSDIHLGFGRVRDSISAKLDFRAERQLLAPIFIHVMIAIRLTSS